MQYKHSYIIINLVTVFAVTLFFSCKNKGSNSLDITNFEDAPDAVGKEIHLKYTDSGRLTAILKTPVILDYTSKEMGYREFPEGVLLDIIDKEGKLR